MLSLTSIAPRQIKWLGGLCTIMVSYVSKLHPVCLFKSTKMWICNPDIQKCHIHHTYWVPQSSLRSIYLNSAYSWAIGIEWNQILIFKLEHNQCNVFLFILLILKVNRKSCIINTWATKSLWPVSNVVLLPCQTQFINYKYTRIHCKSSLNCFLFCKFSFLQQLF